MGYYVTEEKLMHFMAMFGGGNPAIFIFISLLTGDISQRKEFAPHKAKRENFLLQDLGPVVQN